MFLYHQLPSTSIKPLLVRIANHLSSPVFENSGMGDDKQSCVVGHIAIVDIVLEVTQKRQVHKPKSRVLC